MLYADLTTLLTIALLLYVAFLRNAGRNRWISRLLALLLLSPGLRYVSALFMFPIRLQLSEWAGYLMQLAGLNVRTEGNILIKDNVEMAVDPACMGLQLTGVSLIVAFFALIWQEQETRKAVSLQWVVVYGITAFGLTIFCNLLRIIVLVLFEAMPGTWLHEGIGLLCVALYAWLPCWGLARWLVYETGQPEKSIHLTPAGVIKSVSWGVGLLVAGFGLMTFTALPAEPVTDLCQSKKYTALIGNKYGDLTCQTLTNGFVKLSKPGLLLYVKPQLDWFSADHSPMVCWQGSGYDLRRVREAMVDGHPAYAGELHKKGQVLYTAWWFSNGITTTISQLTMRSRMLRSETGFVLINVTTDMLN
ncbi:exosortase N [Spirosoma validum]|uniref:Exosortase N n=1 Tax=Spirosoma validum TaxID=2771355 RepID=A0A927GCN6_9BACT|nr:exosortase N [Spirosoma validum]MBD2752828.1 exosortase N [Spirosoma validum]